MNFRRRSVPVFFAIAAWVAPLLSGSELLDRVAEATKQVESIRGHRFLRPVKAELIGEAALRRLLRARFEEGLPCAAPDYFASLEKLGAIEGASPDMEEKVLDFYASQVLAFYDPEPGRFYLVRTTEDRLSPGTEAEIILVHELTHALQDQKLRLAQRLKALKENSDSALALQALLEGEATLVMVHAALQGLPDAADEEREKELAPLLASSVADLEGSSSELPRFFVEQLFFPYTQGTVYVLGAKGRGGWKAIDELWRHPPETTAAILHPERAVGAPEAVPAPPWTGPDSPRLLFSDTLGEWTFRFLFRQRIPEREADAAAALWRGDRFSFGNRGGTYVAAGRVRLGSPADAARFAGAWKRLGRGKATVDGRDVVITVE